MNAKNWTNYIFGPLSEKYCVYFLIMSILAFVVLVLVGIVEVHWLLTHPKWNFRVVFSGLVILLNLFLVYFVNRLFYSKCIAAL